jgi:hypothetical protein
MLNFRNFLYFLSKTDKKIIERCPKITKDIQASLGFFVLLTGVFALISGSYAISNMFTYVDENMQLPAITFGGRLSSILIGLLYSIFIMAIDREIVSASSKRVLLFRFPLAIIISLIISVPIEMKIFDQRITASLKERYQKQKGALLKTNREISGLPKIEKEIIDKQREREDVFGKYNSSIAARTAELVGEKNVEYTGKPGVGRAYRLAEENIKRYDSLVKKLDTSIVKLKNEYSVASLNVAPAHADNTYDLLSKYIELNTITQDNESANRLSWGILILFFLFETIPSLIKLFTPRSEYDAILENRRISNISSVELIFEKQSSVLKLKSIDDITIGNQITVENMLDSQST